MPSLIHVLLMFGLCFGVQNKLPFLHGKTAFTDALLRCSYCVGFHCGWMVWFMSAAVAWSWPESGLLPNVVSVVAWAFTGSATCYLLDTGAGSVEKSVAYMGDYIRVIAAANGFRYGEDEGSDDAETG